MCICVGVEMTCVWGGNDRLDYRSKAATAPRPAPPPLPPGGLALKSPSVQTGFLSPSGGGAGTSFDEKTGTTLRTNTPSQPYQHTLPPSHHLRKNTPSQPINTSSFLSSPTNTPSLLLITC